MRGDSMFLTLLKATRLERAVIPLSFIFLVSNFVGKVNIGVGILSLCCVLLYISGGILNAKVDGDFKLKYHKQVLFFLTILTLGISFYDKIIFFSVISWIILNVVYSKYSRKILFGDSIILSITHGVIPIISTILLTELNFSSGFKITGFSFLLMNLIIPMKNFKGIKEDKENKYKTLLTNFRRGKLATTIIFNLSFLLLIVAPIIFNLNKSYFLILAAIGILYFSIDCLILDCREVEAYKLARLAVLLINLTISFSIFINTLTILASASVIFLYSGYLIFNLKWNTMT